MAPNPSNSSNLERLALTRYIMFLLAYLVTCVAWCWRRLQFHRQRMWTVRCWLAPTICSSTTTLNMVDEQDVSMSRTQVSDPSRLTATRQFHHVAWRIAACHRSNSLSTFCNLCICLFRSKKLLLLYLLRHLYLGCSSIGLWENSRPF